MKSVTTGKRVQHRSRYWFFLACCALSFASLSAWSQAQAQAQAQNAEEKQGENSVQFTCMLWEGPLEKPLFYRDGEGYFPMTPFTGSRSKVHSLKISQEFSLHVEHEIEDQEEVFYRQVGKAPLLSGTKQILFLLFKQEPEKEMEFRILPIDDSLASFPAGSFRFINMTAEDLRVKFAGKIGKVPASKMTLMKSHVTSDGGLIPFLIGNRQGKKVFETRLFAQATGREIVFIGAPKQGRELPSVRFLPQLLPQKLPEPPENP